MPALVPGSLHALIRFKKMNRKSVAINIGPAGVEVRLPEWASTRDPQLREDIAKHLARLAQALPPHLATSQPLDRAALAQEVAAWAERLQVQPARIQVRHLSTRWGSCTSRGNLTFSDRILDMPDPLRQYLICHELIHLRVLNHGPQFRRLLTQAMPDWKQRQEWLASWVARGELAALKLGRGRAGR